MTRATDGLTTTRVAGGISSPGAVFISDFVYLPFPFQELEPVLLNGGAAWLNELAGAGDPLPLSQLDERRRVPGTVAGEVLPAGVGVGVAPLPAVIVRAGTPRRNGLGVVVPISFVCKIGTGRFLDVDADLELSSLDGSFARLSLCGRYRMARREAGREPDAAGARRVAESSLRGLLAAMSGALVARPPPGAS